MAESLLELAERIRRALSVKGRLQRPELERLLLLGESPQDLERSLAFLHGRDEILVDVTNSAIHLRRTLTTSVLQLLEGGSRSIAEIADGLEIPVAVCCDVLGWLSRENRVGIDSDEGVSLR